MSKIEAVIFDWAGTTVDYGCFAPVQAFAEVFKAHGLNPTMEEIRKPMGLLKRDHIKTVLSMNRIKQQFSEIYSRDFTEEDVDQMNHSFEKKLLSILHDFTDLKPKAPETVERLREMGVKIGSTTGYTDEMMEIVTREAKKKGYSPDIWFSPDSTNNIGRPFPYMIFKNMESLHISAVDKVIKAGDTISDIREGRHAGVITVGILEGSSEMGLAIEEYQSLSVKEQEQRKEAVRIRYMEAGADFVIDEIDGILDIINVL